MADPATIIGLTSSIITFIEFGIKAVRLARSIHGTTAEARELDLIAEHVQALSSDVLRKRTNAKQVSEEEQRIIAIATECQQVAKELRKLLATLKMRDDAWSRKMESTRVLLQTLKKKGEIEELWQRLDKLDVRLRDSVRGFLQRDRDSTISVELRALGQRQRDFDINFGATLDRIQSDILKLTEKQALVPLDDEQLARLKGCLDSFEAERVLRQRQAALIQSLYFPEIRRRWEQVPDADHLTNAWLFDQTKTTFLDWLESGSGIYWITGKAGSGKSTLMKHASEHAETVQALTKWANRAELHYPTFFFWNQGFEMQKSQIGLLQSFIYQILRKDPGIALQVCPDRLDHERWEIKELKATLERILSQPEGRLQARYCFFIDGLDEYNGDEEDLVNVLAIFDNNPHVKLCVSSRPRPFLDEVYQNRRQTLAIHEFTKEDMKTHARQRLYRNKKFKELQQTSGAACDELLKQIADRAQGVWLWVYLVTHDLVHAVNRDEDIQTLQRIFDQLPPDLEAYFEHIIRKIKPGFRAEMAQIFLITIEEVQPLPLFAFSLLERERREPNYAVLAPVSPLCPKDVEEAEKSWKGRIQNRCGDLLVVNNAEHPTYLRNPVDFLHRTVRDFLRDSYYEKLQKELVSDFNPLVSLCRIMLFLLKSLPQVDHRERKSITRLTKLVDELLYYAHEAEKRDQSSLDSSLVDLLDEMDAVNCRHAHSMRNHWTHMRDSPNANGQDEYREGGHYSFLALTVQARLVKYVGTKLRSNPRLIEKSGRPLLDYALRPRRVTPITMPYHSQREDPKIDIEMVRLLLEHGADPNRKVHLNDGRTVWALFLLSCYESAQRDRVSVSLKRAWYRAGELLILNGARFDAWIENDGDHPKATALTVPAILTTVFGGEEAGKLQMLAKERAGGPPKSPWYARWGFWSSK